jgi:hypothetical protein
MKFYLYQVTMGNPAFTGQMGKLFYKNGVSPWITKEEADHAISSSIAKSGYIAVHEYESKMPVEPQNLVEMFGRKFKLPGEQPVQAAAAVAPPAVESQPIPAVQPEKPPLLSLFPPKVEETPKPARRLPGWKDK